MQLLTQAAEIEPYLVLSLLCLQTVELALASIHTTNT